MKNSKVKGLLIATAILASPLVVSTHAHAATSSFTDIAPSFSKDAILSLQNASIVHGYSDGSFNPNGNINRQDFAIILAKALNLDISKAPNEATFSDVSSYASPYVEAVVKAGLISGYDATHFGGSDNVSRQDMAIFFVRSLGVDVTGHDSKLNFDDNGAISSYAKDAVASAVEAGLINGGTNGAFDPKGTATREQVAEVAYTFIQAQKPDPIPAPVQNHAPVANTIGEK